MQNDEIKEILRDLEFASGIFDYTMTCDRCTFLKDYITNLQQENEELKKNQRYNKKGAFCLEYDKETLRDMVDELQQELQRKDNIINELKNSINNFDVFKEFTFPLMKRDEEQQVKSSIDYEWRKNIKEPFLDKIRE